jgi:hypothetical protein
MNESLVTQRSFEKTHDIFTFINAIYSKVIQVTERMNCVHRKPFTVKRNKAIIY